MTVIYDSAWSILECRFSFKSRSSVANVDDCNHMIVATAAVGAAANVANLYLIFMRARAVFLHNKPMIYVFGFMWISVAACYVSAPFALSAVHVGTTRRCTGSKASAYGSSGIVAAAVHDTVVFVAITYRLLVCHITGESWQARTHAFFTGADMGSISKVLLQTGQLYYL